MSLRSWFGKETEAPGNHKPLILCAGVEGSGKTTLVRWLHNRQLSEHVPTIRVRIDECMWSNRSARIMDTCGSEQMNRYSPHLRNNFHGIIFVVDGADTSHFPQAQQMLRFLQTTSRASTPILVMINKADLTHFCPLKQVHAALDLPLASAHRLEGRNEVPLFHVVESSFLKGTGMQEGLDWLFANMQRQSPE